MTANAKTGLILSGGGARAAYQVGVLRAIASLLKEAGWPAHQNPFPIICGTSAGAINATALACSAENFGLGLRRLERVWAGMEAHQIYRADSLAMMRSGARWISILSLGWMLRRWMKTPPSSLLNNDPLAELLTKMLDFTGLDASLASGSLQALAITASSYTTGMHLTFYQTLAEIEPWVRSQRLSQRDFISVQHLLASSAIPFIFPSIPLNWNGDMEYCGDGSMRQLAPISPAIHLGAEKILIIGAGRMSETRRDMPEVISYPSIAQIAGHAMSSIFLDSLAVDIERVTRINRTLSMLPDEYKQQTELRPIKILVISPSQRVDEIATRHIHSLPKPIRVMLGGIGATEARGSALASYLLFESSFTIELMGLGYADTIRMKDEVLAFFGDGRVH
ncbi:patatin-like phospholipase family protein [Solimicrobium silvestre]|uniref:Patatin-like phospholipase n=1 Tax=Solimicrobium silvestre TaxID=2099400 RepID=A0A2S9GWJ1_9BURK|nr:patatin-like phospholipase family protein [Solimicrobium silvestre]PRC92068.1 Patatin-like phospholipase [Solimicrobium silvestre]